jgi:curved DNA-binding protein CbpA
MFVDYYAILDINENATQDEIRAAFKRQALRWHPDRNAGVNTTVQMQQINEAYLILKDNDARLRYDQEYQRFKEFKKVRVRQTQDERKEENNYQHNTRDKSDDGYAYQEYKVEDDLLKKWMSNAKRQAVDLAAQAIDDIKKMTYVGARAAVQEAIRAVLGYFIMALVISIIFIILRKCN